MNQYQQIPKWYVGLSVLYVITGLVMCIWPNLSIDLLGTTLGVGMLVVGLVYIILYFTKDHLEGIMQTDLTIGVVLAAFGAFMLMHKDFAGIAIPFGIGILLLIGGISKIQYSLDMKKLQFQHWKLMLIVAGILMLMGAVLIYNPFRENVLIYFIAVCLMADGVSSIVCILTISHRMKQMSKGWQPKPRGNKRDHGHPGGPGQMQGMPPQNVVEELPPAPPSNEGPSYPSAPGDMQ